MEDATWDGMSESSFELVEAPDARVISSPDLSPAPSLHEDGFEALEAGSPCSSSGGATAVLERSLCFTAMEEEATVGAAVSASSRASSMDGYPAAGTALCEDSVDSTSPTVEPASPVAPAAATDPTPEELPAATALASKLPVAAATLGDDGADSTAQGPATVAGSVPLVAPFGHATATAAAAAGASAVPLEDPFDVSFWSTPAGMRLYAALSGTAAKPGPGPGEPAGGPAPRAVVAPPAAPAAKATALVTLAVVLVSMGTILVSVGRPSQPKVEATGCGVAPQDGPAWSRRCVMLYAPWDGLQSNASSHPSVSISSSKGVSGASSNASFTNTGQGPSWIPLSLDGYGWPLNWRPFRNWPCSLSAVAAAAGRSSSNASNCKQTAAATGNATRAETSRQQHAGGRMGRPAPGGSTRDFAAFLSGVRGMWGDGAHANWSIWHNATPSVQGPPTACRPGRPAYSAVAVPSQAAGGVVLLPWLPGMKPKVWFNHSLFQAAGGRTAAARPPLMYINSSSQPPALPAAVAWNGSFTGIRAGRPAWAIGRLARPLPPWYLPTPPCYNLHALPARAALAAEGPSRWPVAAMLPAPQAGVAGCNHTLIAAAAASKHPTTEAAASAGTAVPGGEASSATSGVRGAAAAAAMPAAQAATAAAPQERQGPPLSAAPTQDQQQQLALEAVRELVGGVLQRLRHMQQQHSGSWGRILDLLPPHFVVDLQQVANTTQSLLSHLALPSGLPTPASSPVLGTAGGGSKIAGSSGTDNPLTEGNATLPAGSEGTAADLQAGAGTPCLLGRCKVSTGRPGGLMGYVMALAAMAPSSASSSSRGFLLRRPSSTGLVLAQPRHVMPVHMGTSRATCELPDTSEATNLRDAPPHVLKAMLESTLSLPAAETRVQKQAPLRHTSPAAAAPEETPAAQQGATKRVPAAAASPPPTTLHFMALPPAPREAHARLAPAAAPIAVALAPAETRYVLVERQGLLEGLVAVPQLPESEQPYRVWDALASDGNHSSELQAPAAGGFHSRSNGSSAAAGREQHVSAVRGGVDELGFVDVPVQAQARAYTRGSLRPCAAAAAASLTSATPATSSNHTKRSTVMEPHMRGPRAACSWQQGGCAGAAAGRHRPTGAALGQQPVFAAQTGKQADARGNRTMEGSSAKHGAAATMPAAAATTSAQPGRQQQNSSIGKEWPLNDFLTARRLGSAPDYHPQQQRTHQAAPRQVVEAERTRSRTQGRPHQQQPQRQQQQAGPCSSVLNGSTRSTAGRSGPPHQQQQQARHTKAPQPQQQQQQQRLGCDCLDVLAPWEQVMRFVSAASLAHMHTACATQQHLLQRLARTSQAASKRLQRHLHRFKRTLHTQGWHLGDWEQPWGAAEEWLGGSGTTWAGWVSDMQRWTHPVCDAAKQLQQLHARWRSRCKHCSIYDAPAAAKRRASQVTLCDCSACCNWAQPLLERLLDSQPYARLILNQLSRFSGPGQRSVAAWWRHLQQMSMQGGPEYMRAFRRAWGHKGLPQGMHQALQDLLQLLAQLPDQEAAA